MKKGSLYRPPQAEFNEASVKAFGGEVMKGKFPRKIPAIAQPSALIYDETAFVGPFAYKEYPIRNLDTEEVSPAPDEVTRFVHGFRLTNFERTIPGFEQQMAISLGRTILSAFDIGDVVRFRTGSEFAGLQVRVKSIEGELVRAAPADREWEGQDLEFRKEELERFFSEGDHVKITGNEYSGETGEIVAVDKAAGNVDLLLDGFRVTVNVPLATVQPTKEGYCGRRSLGVYTVHDPVKLADGAEGVIYPIENNTLFVLLTNRETVAIQLARVGHNAKSQHVRDRSGKVPITVGQMVKVDQGIRGMRARVLHTTAHAVFVFSEELHENRGVTVVDPKDVQAPAVTPREGMIAVPRGFMVDPNRHEYGGKVVRIVKGPFKGELADVKEADDSMLRVILQSSGKRTNLNRSDGDGRAWMFLANTTKPWAGGGGGAAQGAARDRTEVQNAFTAIFGTGGKKKKYRAVDQAEREVQNREGQIPRNYRDVPRQTWGGEQAGMMQTSGAGSPYSSSGYPGSPFSVAPTYDQRLPR
jgi:transcription antitermination factor NusG